MGFEIAAGRFFYGGTEITGTIVALPGQDNKWFGLEGNEAEMLNAMKTGSHQGGSRFVYHAYRYVNVPRPNPAAGRHMALESRNWGYTAIGNNCMDHTYRVITAYASGDGNLLPWPLTHPAPNNFYDSISAVSQPLARLNLAEIYPGHEDAPAMAE
jgi:hypothetical protein